MVGHAWGDGGGQVGTNRAAGIDDDRRTIAGIRQRRIARVRTVAATTTATATACRQQ
jgi:hypothetical protein